MNADKLVENNEPRESEEPGRFDETGADAVDVPADEAACMLSMMYSR
jgi:hypothetical protein